MNKVKMLKLPQKFFIRYGLITAFVLIFTLPTAANNSQAEEKRIFNEYQVQAAYLINFIRFTTWPATAFDNDGQDIFMGLLGEDFFGDALDAIDGLYINKRYLHVLRLDRSDTKHCCHVLYISSSERRHLKQILAFTKDKPVLTVSDMDNFAKEGGIIQIKKVGDKIKLIINNHAAQNAGLKLRANLLKIATLVGQ